jgi:hypothetical protein
MRGVLFAMASVLIGGCYQPDDVASCTLRCELSTGTGCPNGLSCVDVGGSGRCSANTDPASCTTVGDGGPMPDLGDPAICVNSPGSLLESVCPPVAQPPDDGTFDGSTIDTSTCTTGAEGTLSGTAPILYCLVFRDQIVIGLDGLRAIGRFPLVLASNSKISIQGRLDAGSYSNGALAGSNGAGANTNCVSPGLPGTDGADQAGQTFGGGGGAGGSFQGRGGSGGVGEKDAANGIAVGGGETGTPQLLALRGGCPGGNGGLTGEIDQGSGTGASGGGAVYLIARDQIEFGMNAEVLAGGAGGIRGFSAGGGGGGGAGGLIAIDAGSITSVGIGPRLCANGGGGSGGSEANMQGSNGLDACGSNGQVAGGPGGSTAVEGGGGGLGSGGTIIDGGAGVASSDGGGGGGGAAGYIQLYRAMNPNGLGSNASPIVGN